MRIHLLEIGEAVKAVSAEVLAIKPTIPWRQIACMRDNLAHRYFDTNHAIVRATAVNDLPVLAAAVARILERADDVQDEPEDPPS